MVGPAMGVCEMTESLRWHLLPLYVLYFVTKRLMWRARVEELSVKCQLDLSMEREEYHLFVRRRWPEKHIFGKKRTIIVAETKMGRSLTVLDSVFIV